MNVSQKFFTLSVLCISAASVGAQQGELAGRAIEMALIRADDLSEVAWPNTPIELTAVPATVNGGKNVYMMLQENGIAPDSGAFTIVYDLNPALTKLDSLASNSVLQLPAIKGSEEIASLLRSGTLLRITVDPALRQEIGQSTYALQGYAASIDQVTSDEPTRAALRELIAWFAQVGKRFRRRTDPPMRHPSLLQLREEAQALYEILDNARKRQASLNESERQQILSIHDDMRIEMEQYGQTLGGDAPKAEGWYDVTVNIKGGDPKIVGKLRVYFTFNGLFRSLPAQPPIPSYGFRQTGSGQSDRLLKKNYQIWAAKDGDPNHPLTPPYLLRIDATSASHMSVDLTMTESSSP